jgi:hypothetical protein
MHRRYFAVALAALMQPSLASQERIVRISALANGSILVDSKKVDVQALDGMFSKLKTDQAVVWYYREQGSQSPTPQAMEVIKLVVKYQLPISMSSKPDFSDFIEADGRSRPRP